MFVDIYYRITSNTGRHEYAVTKRGGAPCELFQRPKTPRIAVFSRSNRARWLGLTSSFDNPLHSSSAVQGESQMCHATHGNLAAV
jgi:hypothetical protein